MHANKLPSTGIAVNGILEVAEGRCKRAARQQGQSRTHCQQLFQKVFLHDIFIPFFQILHGCKGSGSRADILPMQLSPLALRCRPFGRIACISGSRANVASGQVSGHCSPHSFAVPPFPMVCQAPLCSPPPPARLTAGRNQGGVSCFIEFPPFILNLNQPPAACRSVWAANSLKNLAVVFRDGHGSSSFM